MLHDPGVMSATHNSDLVGPEARFPHAYLCSEHLVSSAFHLLHLTEPTLRKGTQGPETPLQALLCGAAPARAESVMWVMPSARRCCSNVSFPEDRAGFQCLLLFLQKKQGLGGIRRVVLHQSSEKRLGEGRGGMRCETCLICASFKTDFRGVRTVG